MDYRQPVRFGVFVTPEATERPLQLAASTLDILSGGRVALGLGAGGFWPAIKACGGRERTPTESVAALEEASQVIRLMR